MYERAAGVRFATLEPIFLELSQAYREGRGISPATSDTVTAYLATRMPATYAAAHAALGELRKRLGSTPVASVLDAGAGTGAASLAALDWFGPFQITLVEREPAMAEVARQVLPEAEIRQEDFIRIREFPPHDLVIASYALGETPRPEVVSRLWQAARIALVVIEPGTPRGFSLISNIRSTLLSAGAHMIAPCPGEGPCPLAVPDWCHFGARVERTSLHRRLKQAERNYEDEKFSYIALGREAVVTADSRIICRPTQQPGLVILETCTPGGVATVRATKRNAAAFRAARRAAWGSEWKQPI